MCHVGAAILISVCMLGKGPSNDYTCTILGSVISDQDIVPIWSYMQVLVDVSVISYLKSTQNIHFKTTHPLIIQVKLL